MKLVTWNVQWCRGVDGRVDPARIVACAHAQADFDVLCLQEVAVGFPGLEGHDGSDQMAALAAALPGYTPIYGAATDVPAPGGGRSRFGNAIFSRLPVKQVFRHALPWPADPTVPSMQRLLLEAVIHTDAGELRVGTTHLEYYSAAQRMAQVEALRAIHAQACAHARAPRAAGREGEPFAFTSRPASAIVCGDFNFRPDGPEHPRLTASFPGGEPRYLDAWIARHPGVPHPPSWGVFDTSCPRICCDFVFVTEDLAPRLREVRIDDAVDASDHQMVIVELGP